MEKEINQVQGSLVFIPKTPNTGNVTAVMNTKGFEGHIFITNTLSLSFKGEAMINENGSISFKGNLDEYNSVKQLLDKTSKYTAYLKSIEDNLIKLNSLLPQEHLDKFQQELEKVQENLKLLNQIHDAKTKEK